MTRSLCLVSQLAQKLLHHQMFGIKIMQRSGTFFKQKETPNHSCLIQLKCNLKLYQTSVYYYRRRKYRMTPEIGRLAFFWPENDKILSDLWKLYSIDTKKDLSVHQLTKKSSY